MRHLGDITKISGHEAPVVDVVIGGSPCQDLSVAGKRAGLAGDRSGLYMEQIRIIKEMREADVLRGRTDDDVRPRYMVWENVPGAFNSNGGKDFAAVIEEAIRVADSEAPAVPVPEKGWPTSGVYADERGRWSVAWRVLDAQFWGVPQRRRRIALVADFGGLSAPEVLFVRKSVSGDLAPGEQKRKETSGDAGKGAGGASKPVVYGIGGYYSKAWESGNPHSGVYEAETSRTLDALNCGYPACNQGGMAVVESIVLDDQGGQQISVRKDGKSPTLRAETHGNLPCVMKPVVFRKGTRPHSAEEAQKWEPATVANTMNAFDTGEERCSEIVVDYEDKCVAEHHDRCLHIVRRLTPLECERLQGFPDGWTDIGEWVDSKGKKHKEADSPRYKALGNSIAIPPWKWVCKRLCACYERDATMASLFDGIGGFPYIWEQLNGKGSCLWASEIEEFPIAVTKRRFGGEADGW